MDANLLIDEVDRQLGEQRSQADAFATRAGLMVAATALLTGILARTLPADHSPGPVLWVIGIAAVMGILVLCLSRLVLGPSPAQITRWSTNDFVSSNDILDAKVTAITANAHALIRAELAFGAQALLTVIGIILLIQSIQAVAVK